MRSMALAAVLVLLAAPTRAEPLRIVGGPGGGPGGGCIAGDGCDASLQWWFDQLDAPANPAAAPRPPVLPPVLPAACTAILAGPPG